MTDNEKKQKELKEALGEVEIKKGDTVLVLETDKEGVVTNVDGYGEVYESRAHTVRPDPHSIH